MDNSGLIHEVEMTIRAMNRCWTEAWNETEFKEYIHPDAVAIVPATPGRLEGRAAYIAGWKSFVDTTKVHEWKERDHHVHIYASGRCAVVTYLFSITLKKGGHLHVMNGRDMFFLVREQRKWLVVADQFSPEPLLT
ncbi:MAG: nuclear transport factor 2 family protein [Methanoregula sp.]|nr:nuclear transport factor 2 family protein [Methanoregula sp.]